MERGDYSHQFFKTQMCRFHSYGQCYKGRDCSHAHTREELRQKPNLRKTSICRHWTSSGFCEKGTRCPFAHGKHELRSPPTHRNRKLESFDVSPVGSNIEVSEQYWPGYVPHGALTSESRSTRADSCFSESMMSSMSVDGIQYPAHQPHWGYFDRRHAMVVVTPVLQYVPVVFASCAPDWSPRSWIVDQ